MLGVARLTQCRAAPVIQGAKARVRGALGPGSPHRKGTPLRDHPSIHASRIRIAHRRDLEVQLNRAVERAIAEALRRPGHGILVTRHDYRTFTVELTREVPAGLTAERDQLSVLS